MVQALNRLPIKRVGAQTAGVDRFCLILGRNRHAVDVQRHPRPVRPGTGSQMGWPLACEELMVKTHPSGPMISNES
jgi:hypothetical protein